MDLVTSNEMTNSDITAECESCQQPFLVKYWDEELDWYIEINLTSKCRNCQSEEEVKTPL